MSYEENTMRELLKEFSYIEEEINKRLIQFDTGEDNPDNHQEPLSEIYEIYEKQQDEISKLKEIKKHKERVIEYILKYELTGCYYRREDYPLCYISHAENPNKMKHCQQCWNKYLNEKARVK